MEGFNRVFNIALIQAGDSAELDRLFAASSNNAACFGSPEERNAIMRALISGISKGIIWVLRQLV
jgi:hypothetical protein